MVSSHSHLAHVQTQAKLLPVTESKTLIAFLDKPSAKAGVLCVPGIVLIQVTAVARIE